MKPLTSNFMRSRFREYYLQASLEVPPGFEEREWGFVLFAGGGMRRHKSFAKRSELVDYIRSMVPAHVYHSAAYYELPGAPTMKEKIWKGADLIFDLDADHLRNAPRSYGDMLDLVKVETLKLLDFLTDDFGFSEDEIRVVFSGGRGYHIHVRDKRVHSLESDARREIVDYLTGRGLDMEKFINTFPMDRAKSREEGGFVDIVDSGVAKAKVLRGPSKESAGWGKRVNHAILSYAEELRDLDEKTAVENLSSIKGFSKIKASKFIDYLKEESTLDQLDDGILDGTWGISGIWNVLKKYLSEEGIQIGLGPSVNRERGETDEPVTADVKRLIRFPMSLHGGSGFRVTPLTVEGLKSFEPLRDAVVFGEEPVPVTVTKPFRLDTQRGVYELEPGPADLPTWVAVFFMGRGAAELGKG